MIKYMWETGYETPRNHWSNHRKWYFESNQQPKEMQEALLSFEREQKKIGKKYTLMDFIKSMKERNKRYGFRTDSRLFIIVKPIFEDTCLPSSSESLQQFVCLNSIAFDEDRYRVMLIGDILGEVVLKKGQTCESMLKEEGLDGYEVDMDEYKRMMMEGASKTSREYESKRPQEKPI